MTPIVIWKIFVVIVGIAGIVLDVLWFHYAEKIIKMKALIRIKENERKTKRL